MRKMILILVATVVFTGCSCQDAINTLWPASSRSWASSIMDRESKNNPSAQNAHSTAAGCFQLLKMHAWRFDAVGYSWNDRYNPFANTLAALHLYNEAGRTPWALR